MSLRNINESFDRVYRAEEEIETPVVQESAEPSKVERALFDALYQLKNQGNYNLKAYEVAFQDVLERFYPDQPWWEVTDVDIFTHLMANRKPYDTIKAIVSSLKVDECMSEEWTDVYNNFIKVTDSIPYACGSKEYEHEAAKRVDALYNEHRGEADWDEAYIRWRDSGETVDECLREETPSYNEETRKFAKKLISLARKDGKKMKFTDACEVLDQAYNKDASSLEDFYKNLTFDESMTETKDLSQKEGTIANVLTANADKLYQYTDAISLRNAVIELLDSSDIADKGSVAKAKQVLMSRKSVPALLSTIGTYMTGLKTGTSKAKKEQLIESKYTEPTNLGRAEMSPLFNVEFIEKGITGAISHLDSDNPNFAELSAKEIKMLKAELDKQFVNAEDFDRYWNERYAEIRKQYKRLQDMIPANLREKLTEAVDNGDGTVTIGNSDFRFGTTAYNMLIKPVGYGEKVIIDKALYDNIVTLVSKETELEDKLREVRNDIVKLTRSHADSAELARMRRDGSKIEVELTNSERDLVSAVIGQMSDGYWENNSSYNKYWKNMSFRGNSLFVNKHLTGLYSVEEIRKFLANKGQFLLRQELKQTKDGKSVSQVSDEQCMWLDRGVNQTYGQVQDAINSLKSI